MSIHHKSAEDHDTTTGLRARRPRPPTTSRRNPSTIPSPPSRVSRRFMKRIPRFCAMLSRAIAATSSSRIACAPAIRSCACAPKLNTQIDSRRSYGFVAGPGIFETTLTRPDLFGDYYREQLRLLAKNHHVRIEVGVSAQPIPIHFAFAEGIHLEGDLDRDRLLAMRNIFDTPDLALLDDRIVNGTYEPAAGRAASARAVHGGAGGFLAASAEALHGHARRRISRTTCSTRTTSSISTSS